MLKFRVFLGSGDLFHQTRAVFGNICTIKTHSNIAICISDRICELITSFSLCTQLLSGTLHLNNYAACRNGQQRLINKPLHHIIIQNNSDYKEPLEIIWLRPSVKAGPASRVNSSSTQGNLILQDMKVVCEWSTNIEPALLLKKGS